MEYLIGLLVALLVAGLAAIVGLDRDRAFYPTVLMVIASYYVLFAVMGASRHTVVVEIILASAFFAVAILGYKRNLWFVVAAIVGHGVFDFVHHLFVHNAGVPPWWRGFCLIFDVIVGGAFAARLMRHATVTP